MTGPDAAQRAADYVPPAYLPPPTIGERLLAAIRIATATPTQSALCVVGGISAVVALVSLRPVEVHGVDRGGPFLARCGVGYYVGGHPDPFVAQVCHAAYGSHALVLTVALATLAIAATVITCLAQRPASVARFVAWVGASRVRASITALAASVAVIGALSLRSVTVATLDSAGPLAAHCGLAYYVVGSSDVAVQRACRRAFAGHAEVAAICLVVFVAAIAVLARTRRADRRTP